MNAIYKELSDEAFVNIALGGNYFKLAHLDEQLGEIHVSSPCQRFRGFFVTSKQIQAFSKWIQDLESGSRGTAHANTLRQST